MPELPNDGERNWGGPLREYMEYAQGLASNAVTVANQAEAATAAGVASIPGLVTSTVAAQPTVVNAAAAAMQDAAVVAKVAYFRGATSLTASADLAALDPGMYAVTNGSIATALGLPRATPGSIQVAPLAATGARTLSFHSTEGGGAPPRFFINSRLSGVWSGWREVTVALTYKGLVNVGLNTLTQEGVYGIASTVTDRPVDLNGTCEVFTVGIGVTQRYTTVTAIPQVYVRRLNTDGSSAFPWVRVDAGAMMTTSDPGVVRRDLLQQSLTARKGGTIGTAGKGAIAIRIDDAPAEFVSLILPKLKARGLPFTRVTTSESINGTPLPSGTFTAMQTYSIDAGGEVWNHGRTHGEATVAELEAEVVGALSTLRAAMPRIPIDCFAPPGGSITWGGYMPSRDIPAWADTVGGRMVYGHHALASGYLPDTYYRPLDGLVRDGQIHYSCDAYTLSAAKTLVNRARDWGTGVVMMWHGNNLGTEGNMSVADFTELLDYIVEQRDAGNVIPLTVSGLAVADKRSTYRDDVLPSSSGANYNVSIVYPQFRQGIPGSTRELVATVTGTAGASVTSVVGESTRTHTIPTGGVLALRHVATIPLDVTALTVSIAGGTTSGASLRAV